jgi:hypothetical protein
MSLLPLSLGKVVGFFVVTGVLSLLDIIGKYIEITFEERY